MAGYLTCDNCGKPIPREATTDGHLCCPECGTPVTSHGTPEAAAGPENTTKPDTYDVILATAGSRKINVIKQIRTLRPAIGLAGAKNLVDTAPAVVLSAVSWELARKAKDLLESEGAFVEIGPASSPDEKG